MTGDSNQVLLFPMSRSELQTLIKQSMSEVLEISKSVNQKDLLSTKELCEFLGISSATLSKWKRENRIPFKKMARRIFYSRSDVLKSLRESNYTKLRSLNI
ncbi:MAG: helix-turn-helix domain-containing protein [Ignavibacteriae bacterium]|nr:helix-turn-helix domain-containing protein [Ignavibacteriota bacterium]